MTNRASEYSAQRSAPVSTAYDQPLVFGDSSTVTRIVAQNPGMMTGPGTNTYLVGGSHLAVIDPGPDILEHAEALAATGGGRIRWILVTHTHPDHAPGAARLASMTGAEVLGFGMRDGFTPDTAIGDGHVLDAGGVQIRAIYTPGHASNHLCYLHESEGVLFSGDHVMDGSTVVIAPPDGDMGDYMNSLRSLRDHEPSMSSIAPGHGNLIPDPRARLEEYIVHREKREEAIANALESAGNSTVAGLVAAVYTDVPEFLHPVAEFSVWAHLRKMATEGIAACSDISDRASKWSWAAG